MASNGVVITYADKQKEKQAHEENNQKVTAGQEGNAAASKVENSSYNGSVDFSMDRDYTAELEAAKASGDKALAAQLEQERNAKIEHLNATGGNQWNAQPSYEYSAYLGANTEKVNDGTKPSYADSYVPKDTSGAGDDYARQNMSASQLAEFDRYGAEWNKAAAAEEQALASAKSEAERTAIRTYYGLLKDYWHQKKETLRGQYGYSGGADGSEYIPTDKGGLGGSGGGGVHTGHGTTDIPKGPDINGLKELPDATKIPDAPDVTSMLDQWLNDAQKQQEAKIDYATQQGITELERIEQDAQQQFQTQRDQVSANEAKALDNQALYAERRGDKGGIGAVQYAAVQNAAMEQRRAVNQAQTKLATDTARQIADLRSQGEFEKADALLSISQTYLSKLVEVQMWSAEYNMKKAQIEESIRQWEAGYQLDVAQFAELVRQWEVSFQEGMRRWEYECQEDLRRWDAEFGLSEGSLTGNYKGNATLDSQKLNNNTMAEAGWTMLQSGILPSASQLEAMGISSSQAQELLADRKQSQSVTGSKPADKPKDDGDVKVDSTSLAGLFADMYKQGIEDFSDAEYYLLKAGVTTQTDRKNWADDYIAKLRSGALKTSYEEALYGAEYDNAMSMAMEHRKDGISFDKIREMLKTVYPIEFLTDEGFEQIMDQLKSY